VSVKESRPVVDRISEVVSPILWALGLELIDVVCVGQGARSIVRVYIDKLGGVTVEDCGRAHLAIGPALDVADPFPHAYTLEVSSPGLERTLRSPEHFARCVGRRAVIKTRERLVADSHRIEGTIAAATEAGVKLKTSSGEVDVPYGQLRSARTIFEWK